MMYGSPVVGYVLSPKRFEDAITPHARFPLKKFLKSVKNWHNYGRVFLTHHVCLSVTCYEETAKKLFQNFWNSLKTFALVLLVDVRPRDAMSPILVERECSGIWYYNVNGLRRRNDGSLLVIGESVHECRVQFRSCRSGSSCCTARHQGCWVFVRRTSGLLVYVRELTDARPQT